MSVISLSGNAVRAFHQSASFVVATTISTSRIAESSRVKSRRDVRLFRGVKNKRDSLSWCRREVTTGKERKREEGEGGRERNCVSRAAQKEYRSRYRRRALDGRETRTPRVILFNVPGGSPGTFGASDIRGAADRPIERERESDGVTSGQCRCRSRRDIDQGPV